MLNKQRELTAKRYHAGCKYRGYSRAKRPASLLFWTNKQAGIRRERGCGGIPLGPCPIKLSQGAFRGNPPVSLIPPISLLEGFPVSFPPKSQKHLRGFVRLPRHACARLEPMTRQQNFARERAHAIPKHSANPNEIDKRSQQTKVQNSSKPSTYEPRTHINQHQAQHINRTPI